jgi:hypothetical protein
MIAAEIAEKLGGARRSGHWWRCVCPVGFRISKNPSSLTNEMNLAEIRP